MVEIRKKLKVCIVDNGEKSTTIPKGFEQWVLKRYVQTNGWNCSGSAFSGEDTFIIWIDSEGEIGNELSRFLPKAGVNCGTFEIVKQKNNWFNLDYSIVIEARMK